MPFKRGQPRPAGAGRKKGAIAKRTVVGSTMLGREVSALLQELNCNPIEGMAKLAIDPKNDAGIRMRCFAELAQYVYPKRRAIEHSGTGGDPIEFRNADSAKRALEDRISGIADRIRQGVTPQ